MAKSTVSESTNVVIIREIRKLFEGNVTLESGLNPDGSFRLML